MKLYRVTWNERALEQCGCCKKLANYENGVHAWEPQVSEPWDELSRAEKFESDLWVRASNYMGEPATREIADVTIEECEIGEWTAT